MKLTGHTMRATHKTYTHLELAGLRNAVTTLPLLSDKEKQTT